MYSRTIIFASYDIIYFIYFIPFNIIYFIRIRKPCFIYIFDKFNHNKLPGRKVITGYILTPRNVK